MENSTADDESMKTSIGSVVAARCEGEEAGYYQGKLAAVDPVARTITLACPLRDGVPIGQPITLKGANISTLRVLKTAAEMRPAAAVAPVKSEKKDRKKTEESSEEREVLPTRLQKKEKKKREESSEEREVFPTQLLLRSQNKRETRTTSTSTLGGATGMEREYSRHSKQHRGRRHTHGPSATSSGNSSPSIDAEEAISIAPTPLFRKFDPQVPQPTILNSSMRYSTRTRRAGPSGIPALDARRGRTSARSEKDDLSRPLDFNLLNTDFDFESNLKLFNKDNEEEDDNFYEEFEVPKMSANFAHYENIIGDPSRVTSWTKVISKHAYSELEEKESIPADEEDSATSIKASSARGRRRPSSVSRRLVVSQMADTLDGGIKLPVLDEKEKARLAKETRALLGDEAYSIVLADRIVQCIFSIISTSSLLVERVALLWPVTSPGGRLLERLLLQLSSRGCRVSLFGASLQRALPLVELVASERDLPYDVQMIIDMDPAMQAKSRSAELILWIGEQKQAQVVCLEHLCEHVEERHRVPLVLLILCHSLVSPFMEETLRVQVHVLMIGALSTSVIESLKTPAKVKPTVGPTSFAILCGAASPTIAPANVLLMDMGVPYSWFGEQAADSLAALFATTFIASVKLSQLS